MGSEFFYPPGVMTYPADPKDTVKKQLRALGTKIGCGIIVMQLLSQLFAYFYRWIVQYYGLNNLPAEAFGIFHRFAGAFSYCLYIFVPFLLIAYSSRIRLGDALKFSSLKGKSTGAITLFGMGIFMLCNTLTFWVMNILQQAGVSYKPSGVSVEGTYTPVGIAFSVLSTAILPALFEEFALRGIVLSSLKKYGNGFAVFGSAIIFALLHPSLPQLPFAFLGGLILGYITVAADSLLPAILLHCLNNSYSLAGELMRHFLPAETANAIMMGIVTIACGASVIAGIVLLKRGNNFLRMPPINQHQPDVISFGQKVKQLLINFGMIPAGAWLLYKVITNGVTFFGQGG